MEACNDSNVHSKRVEGMLTSRVGVGGRSPSLPVTTAVGSGEPLGTPAGCLWGPGLHRILGPEYT